MYFQHFGIMFVSLDSKALLQESEESDGNLSSSIDFTYEDKDDEKPDIKTLTSEIEKFKKADIENISIDFSDSYRAPSIGSQFTCDDPDNSDSLGTIESIFENVLISSVPPMDIDTPTTAFSLPPPVKLPSEEGIEDMVGSPIIPDFNPSPPINENELKSDDDQSSVSEFSSIKIEKVNVIDRSVDNSPTPDSSETHKSMLPVSMNSVWKSRKITVGGGTRTRRKVLSCDICNIVFHYKKDLSTHLLKIHDVKLFSCEVCQKRFTYRHSLERHKSIHTGVKPYSCDVCGKRFIERHSLKRHKNVHDGIKTFTCDICHMKFQEKHGLTRHRSVHDNSRAFGCNTCSKRFAHRQSLARHRCTNNDLRKNNKERGEEDDKESSQTSASQPVTDDVPEEGTKNKEKLEPINLLQYVYDVCGDSKDGLSFSP